MAGEEEIRDGGGGLGTIHTGRNRRVPEEKRVHREEGRDCKIPEHQQLKFHHRDDDA